MSELLTNGAVLFCDLSILLIATAICRHERHANFWALILPVTIVVVFMFLVASDIDNLTNQNLLGAFGDFPIRSILWRSMFIVGLTLRWFRAAVFSYGKKRDFREES